MIDHRVDRVFQLEDFAANVDGDLLRQIAGRDGSRHFSDVANLRGEIARHRVDGICQVFPRAGDSADLRLSAEFSLGADFSCNASDFRGKGVELVDHRIDRVLQLEDFAANVDRDFFRQVSHRHRRRDVGNVAHLRREIAGHGVHRIGQVFPRAGDAGHFRLSAQTSFRSDFASHARDLGGERCQLRHHRIHGLRGAEELSLQWTSIELDGHRPRQIAARHGADDA